MISFAADCPACLKKQAYQPLIVLAVHEQEARLLSHEDTTSCTKKAT